MANASVLQIVIQGRLLGSADATCTLLHRRFLDVVETYVQTVSQMLHRAGLALLLHLLHQASNGLPIPNLYDQKSTYWKNWLKLALDEVRPNDDPVRQAFEVTTGEIKADKVHDQVIGYAAITFKTVVTNNAWVPLVPRIVRLTKAIVRSHAGPGPSTGLTDKIVKQIRAKEPTYDGLPAWAINFVKDVRTRLHMNGTTYLHDDYAKKKKNPNITFPDLFMFNFWLQQRLVQLEEKRIALSPLFRVRRAFVRLDKKVLLGIAKATLPSDPSIQKLVELEKTYGHVKNPDKGAHALVARLPSRKKDEAKQDYDARVAPVVASNAKVRASEEYKLVRKQYIQMCNAKRAVASSLFNVPKKAGFRFDGTITTDGVAVCLQYSKPKPQQQAAPAAPVTNKPPSKRGTKAKGKDTSILYPSQPTYDPVSNTIVLGADPGRTNIVTIAYVLNPDSVPANMEEAFKPQAWSDDWTLSRRQFYADSGIRKENTLKSKRFESVHQFWTQGGHDMEVAEDIDHEDVIAALRTASVNELMAYIARYAQVRDEWWSLALRRRESRADFKRYSGKRKVLDGFFSNVKKVLEKRFPKANVQIAYGSAFQTMKPTGKGEVAVPVHATYKSCCRVFGLGRVVPTDEYGSTKYDWDTGCQKLAVYRKVVGRRNGEQLLVDASDLGTTGNMAMPNATNPDDIQAVRMYMQAQKARVRRSTNGHVVNEPNLSNATRYPEVRGLRFLTETRTYLNRDLHAARTIGRLRTAELMGRARPTPFCR